MVSERAVTECEQCGQADDHPKVNMTLADGSTRTVHHDCLSKRERAMVIGGEGNHAAEKIIKACEDGKRGADLLGYIEKVKAAS